MKKEAEEKEPATKEEENVEKTEEKPSEATEEQEIEELTEELEKEEETPKEAVKVEEEEETPAKEEQKPSKKEKEEGEEIVEERIYTIPLSRAWIMPANKRAPRAIRILKSFIIKNMKFEAQKEAETEEEEEPKKLVISNDVNLKVWSRGIEKPPRKIRVRAAKDKEGNITVYLAEGD
ncbi:50S ribosomal protein L31e [Candidatus Bathyarchaeota archaeon]|nr:50S ribosomal protein L31e [Candidatus Bathyarchaeota archaeon]